MDKLISLCMIVKNEENVIERCLQSVSGLVDEVIIIDTGSTDRTLDIVSQYTNHVYHFDWINDFSAARNEGIKKASGKWILILDADEYVQQENIESLRQYLMNIDSKKQQAVELTVYNIVGGANIIETLSIRIFLNIPEIFYTNPIHEQVHYTSGAMAASHYPFIIYHTGYLPEVIVNKKKSERNMAILENIQAHKQLSPYECFTLGNEYMVQRKYKEAAENYTYAYKHSTIEKQWHVLCTHSLIQARVNLGQLSDALQIVDDGIFKWSTSTDFYFTKGNILKNMGFIEEAIDLFHTCLTISDRSESNKFWQISADSGVLLPNLLLSELYLQILDIPKAVHHLTRYIQINHFDTASLCRLVQLLMQTEDLTSIRTFLDKLYPANVTDSDNTLFKMSILLGNRELAEHYYGILRETDASIPSFMLLRYGVIIGNKSIFDQALLESDADLDNQTVNRSLLMAACIWKDAEYLGRLVQNSDHISAPLAAYLYEILRSESKSVVYQSNDFSQVINLLTDLFTSFYFDTYDWVISLFQVHQAEIANSLGDYFFSINQIQLALDYYSILLHSDQLRANGYMNLARLYLSQENRDEAIGFVEKAISINPGDISMYVTLISNISNHKKKAENKKKLIKMFPEARRLKIIQQL